MSKITRFGLALAATFCGVAASAGESLQVAFLDQPRGSPIRPVNAGCVASAADKAEPGPNKSPAVGWSDGPAGTRSYALTMIDRDVPVDLSSFDKPGTTIAYDAPRRNLVHWILADIPQAITHLPEGAEGDGLPKGGLPFGRTDHGVRGRNGFAAFLQDGPHGGYGGPCPPWNDERIHRYRIIVYALDVPSLNLLSGFTEADLLAAARGHSLASGFVEAPYSLNPDARP